MFLFKGMMRAIAGIIFLIWMPTVAWAASGNPISYTLTPSTGFPSTTQVGSNYSVHYVLKNNLPFNVTIKNVSRSISGIGFTVTDACSGKTLAANGTCLVTTVFQPVKAGPASLQFTLMYDKNVVPLPTLSTTAQSSATLEMSGVVTEALPADTTVNTGYQVEFAFTNNSGVSITASGVELTGDTSHFVVSSNNCTLPVTDSCYIVGTYTPASAGEKTIGATFVYQSGLKSVALSTHTIASNSSGGCASVSGTSSLILPTETYIYANNDVKFTFTNQCDAASATLGTVNLNATYTGSSSSQKVKKKLLRASANNWITRGSDTCSGATLAANGSCTVYASIVPAATGSNLLLDATVSYAESSQSKLAAASTASDSILANDGNNRMVTIVNQCPAPVWMTFLAAAIPNSPSCTTNADCPSYATCTAHICYFSNPSLDGKHTLGRLAGAKANQAPDTMNISVPEDNAGVSPTNNILYNAGIGARLGCTATGVSTNPLVCTANNCGGTANPGANTTAADGQCTPGVGVSNSPGMTFNAVEFTFLRNYIARNLTTDGVYDEQTINGVNVPMEMKGRGPFTSGTVPYSNCQTAGGLIQQITGSISTQLGMCGYDYSTPAGKRASNYRFVTFASSATDCTLSDNSCTGTDVCGLTYDSSDNKIKKRCGSLVGYVSVNTGICSHATTDFSGTLGTDLYAIYNCSTSYTYSTGTQLYACSGTYASQSCYNPLAGNPAASCCGCVDWWTSLGGSQTVPTSTKSCGIYVNPDWADPAGIVQSEIQWVKNACPTAYSYQYDDPSSQFLCTVTNNGASSNGKIVTNYQVTFCPGGKEVSTIKPS